MSIARDIADDINVGNVGLPLKDSNNADVLAEDINGVVTLTADQANVGSNALVVDSSGNVGIGTNSPQDGLDVAKNARIGQGQISADSTVGVLGIYGGLAGSTTNSQLRFFGKSVSNTGLTYEIARISGSSFGPYSLDGGIQFSTASNDGFNNLTLTERMRIDNNGKLSISASGQGIQIGPDIAAYTIKRDANGLLNFRATQTNFNGYIFDTVDGERMRIESSGIVKFLNAIDVFNNECHFTRTSTYTDPQVGVARDAKFGGSGISAVSAYVGTLSKGSGSFQIDHPLPEKSETHHLVHSFVEAPQADNIYRGKVELVAGQATVNIDTIAGMTEGTFVLLNRDVQCFTTNETGWTAVRGSVNGNIITIEAQDNTCTDTVSWLVIGERQDQHMYDTDWTDDNGKVIVEPLKPEPRQS